MLDVQVTACVDAYSRFLNGERLRPPDELGDAEGLVHKCVQQDPSGKTLRFACSMLRFADCMPLALSGELSDLAVACIKHESPVRKECVSLLCECLSELWHAGGHGLEIVSALAHEERAHPDVMRLLEQTHFLSQLHLRTLEQVLRALPQTDIQPLISLLQSRISPSMWGQVVLRRLAADTSFSSTCYDDSVYDPCESDRDVDIDVAI